MSELGRRSARLANSNQPMKPLGVCYPLNNYDRKSVGNCLKKSPNSARKILFDTNSKENEDYALCKEISSKRENTGKSPVVVPNFKSTHVSPEKKKVKPRRSMLGLRSKTRLSSYVKDDAALTILKPSLAPSPKAERLVGFNHRDLRKSISTPQLTPFDSDDVDSSAFFNKGISESTWSVFKSVKKKNIFEPPSTRGSLMPGKASESSEVSEEYQEEKSNSTLKECLSPIEKMNNADENDLSSANSEDSYIQNETAIMNSAKNNLEKIEEENGDKEDSSYDEKSDDCDESDGIDIHRIINLFEGLKNGKEVMDSKWSAFTEQREVFEKKWDDFNFLLRAYEKNVTTSKKKSTSSNSVQGKSNVSTKLRPSFINAANICLKLPKAPSNPSSSNRYIEKKSNFSNCKTPLSNDKLLKRFRKSTCYITNSLSTKVDDEAKDIFGG